MATFQNNSGPGEVDLDVTIEDDEGPFLSVTTDGDLDLFITDRSEVEYFFSQVAEAKTAWEKAMADQ